MKYALLALALVAAIPGCSCMRKDKDKAAKKEKMQTKDVKKSADKATKKANSGKEHMSSY